MTGESEPPPIGSPLAAKARNGIAALARCGPPIAQPAGAERVDQRLLRGNAESQRTGAVEVLRPGEDHVNQRPAQIANGPFVVRRCEGVEHKIDRRIADAVHAHLPAEPRGNHAEGGQVFAR